MEFLIWLENTSFSTAIRESESLWGYGGLLILHGMGMAIAVGISSMIGLRLLGFAPGVPVEPFRKFFPFIWAGFWVNALSGGAIMMSQATVMFTNWMMYIKLASIILAVIIVRLIYIQVFRNSRSKRPGLIHTKVLAGALLFLWAVAITAGRLTAYLGALIDPSDLALIR